MSKRDFYPMFMAAWEASFKETTILKAFEATGLSSFNPEVIPKRFIPYPPPCLATQRQSSLRRRSMARETEANVYHACRA